MTHSGGKPHAVGDEGQRYEISYYDPVEKSRQVYGWTDDLIMAQELMRMLGKHPVWKFTRIRDRKDPPQ